MKEVSEWKLIPIEQVPKGRTHRPYVDWDKLFAKIPHGNALALTEEDITIDAPRKALKSRQNKGKLLEYSVTQKKIKGVVCIYIVRR